jgi:hypothetical protein
MSVPACTIGCDSVGAGDRGLGRGGWEPLGLVVDGRAHAEEIRRFEGLVVRGPGADDCAIWAGPVGADGYPRCWVRRGGGTRIMLRGNRYALALSRNGATLESWERALPGWVRPVCVRVSVARETGLLHVVAGTQRDNMIMMARAGRAGGRPQVRRGECPAGGRQARAVALREAACDGWDADAVAQVLVGTQDPTVWERTRSGRVAWLRGGGGAPGGRWQAGAAIGRRLVETSAVRSSPQPIARAWDSALAGGGAASRRWRETAAARGQTTVPWPAHSGGRARQQRQAVGTSARRGRDQPGGGSSWKDGGWRAAATI